MDQPNLSYSRGSQDKTLLAETIGQAFDRTVARYPEGEAGGASSALPLHLAATGRDRGSACPCVRLHHPRHYHDLPQ
ncbi:hypothetical protein [Pseudomonas sp. R2-37-08W]|uniref:hypothetical protein n=1 Tax=Pseudomonas sp. R2-37-08W TaxID=1173273 RepID=UPI0021157F4C|nr:hypothetical protein [Pseudomonas sp. R2-37-08W]